MTARSDDSVTPIVGQSSKPRDRKPSSATKLGQVSQKNIRQVIDTLRRQTRRSTNESLEGASSAKGNDSEFDDSELYFLHWLDGEIKKIDDFYQEKEKEAEGRFKLLSDQLEMLRYIRETQLQNDPNIPSRNPSRAEPNDGSHGFTTNWIGQPIGHIRASLDGLSSAMPAADHERRAKQPELMAHPFAHTMGYVEYRIAKRRLREALLEFYRGLELLKGYRLLNRTGLAKIIKKFDKISGRKLSGEYAEKLKSMHFDHSNTLDNIMTHTEVQLHLKILTLGFVCTTL
jgi:xenotropic and polytropic retrovirus receptor 1